MERSRYGEIVEKFGVHLTSDGKSANTVASYTRDVGEFLDFLASHDAARVDQITEQQVAGFIAGLAVRDLGERSKAKKLTSIRSFLVWARQEGFLESYPRKLSFAKVRERIHADRAAAEPPRAAQA